MVQTERVRGFRDVFPEESEPRKAIFEKSERAAEAFGFKKIEMPSVEYMDLYRSKSGDELVSQCFAFYDKGGREITLVPEATPSVVRMLTSRKDLPRPVKWYSFQKYWRYEEPQAGRLREFYQFNGDIFGPDTPEADAEVIGLALSILDSLNLRGEYKFFINDRNLVEAILRKYNVTDNERAFALLDKFRKVDRATFEVGLESIGLNASEIDSFCDLIAMEIPMDRIAEFFSSEKLKGIEAPIKERLVRLSKILVEYTVENVFLDLSTVRGLAYYTGVVFEAFDSDRKFRSILGGGRYNKLADLYSGQAIPAVGFGMGDVVLENLLNDRKKLTPSTKSVKVYACYTEPGLYTEALKAANILRKSGIQCAIDVSGKSFSSQMKEANKEAATYLLIIGRKEVDGSFVSLKDMGSSVQEEIKLNKLSQWFLDRAK